MAKFFSTDGKVYQFMSRLTDILKLNFMWILCSLPLFTIGAATIAAFTVTLRMVEDTEGHIARSFLKAFKANLKQGIFMSFFTVGSAWAVYLNFEIFNSKEEIFFLIVAIVSAYIVIFAQLYAYPLLARYENTIIKTLMNSFRISMKYFLRSLFIIAVVALEVFLVQWSTTTMLIGVLIGPAAIFLTMSGPIMPLFRKIDKDTGNEEEEKI